MIDRRKMLINGMALGCGVYSYLAMPALAESIAEQNLIDKSAATISSMGREPFYGTMKAYMKNASGILIVPQIIKLGFIIGGAGGSGVLLARSAASGEWSAPAFCSIYEGSIGLQAGVQAAELILIIRNSHGLEALLKNRAVLGTDLSVTLGPAGGGAQAATTTNLGSDVCAFSRSIGLFAGLSLDGMAVLSSPKANKAYYGDEYSQRDIVLNNIIDDPGTAHLRQVLSELTT